jgi:hypothetical protein
MTAVQASWSLRSSGFAKTPLNAEAESRTWRFRPLTRESISSTLARRKRGGKIPASNHVWLIRYARIERARQGGEMADAYGTEPGGTEPGGTEPGGTEPGATEDDFELHGFEPGGTEPGGTEPGATEPSGTEPGGFESA